MTVSWCIGGVTDSTTVPFRWCKVFLVRTISNVITWNLWKFVSRSGFHYQGSIRILNLSNYLYYSQMPFRNILCDRNSARHVWEGAFLSSVRLMNKISTFWTIIRINAGSKRISLVKCNVLWFYLVDFWWFKWSLMKKVLRRTHHKVVLNPCKTERQKSRYDNATKKIYDDVRKG